MGCALRDDHSARRTAAAATSALSNGCGPAGRAAHLWYSRPLPVAGPPTDSADAETPRASEAEDKDTNEDEEDGGVE